MVQVTLIDKAGMAGLSKSMKLGMGMKGDMKNAKMAVNANPKVVTRGTVKFNVTNLASELVHEVILAEVNDENQTLTYDETRDVVDEETIQTLGQVAEIAPSRTATVRALMVSIGETPCNQGDRQPRRAASGARRKAIRAHGDRWSRSGADGLPMNRCPRSAQCQRRGHPCRE